MGRCQDGVGRLVNGGIGRLAGFGRLTHRGSLDHRGRFQPGSNLLGCQRTQQPQQVSHPFHAAGAPVRRQALQLELRGLDDLRVQQFTELHPAQQLIQERRVQCQGGGTAFCERGVALIQELRHVPEQQGLGEGRRLLGGGLHNPQFTAFHRCGNVLQGREVVDVLEALADRFQHDRERGVFPRDVQQLGRPLALLPQGLPLPGSLPREQQGAGSTLAEA